MSNVLELQEREERAAVETAVIISIDWHADQLTVCRQMDGRLPQPAQKLSHAEVLKVVGKHVSEGHRVFTCYEAGPGGYVLHRELVALGATNHVVAPEAWAGRVKTDKRDTREMCRRLVSYVRGNTDAFTVIFVPSPEQERRRAMGRQRGLFVRERQRCEVRGHGLLLAQGLRAPRRWWTETEWEELRPQLPEWLVDQVEPWGAQARKLQELVDEITPKVEALVAGQAWPKGFGALSLALVWTEVCDWNRFHNRRHPAGYTGLCPSEDTSNRRRRQGSVSKCGNPRLRHVLVEAVWRMTAHQPDYPPIKRLKGTSGRIRKRLIVAAARRLCVDLWRLYTGRRTAAELKLNMKD